MDSMQSLDTLHRLQGIAGFVLFGGLAAMALLEVLAPRDASIRSLRRVLHGTHNLVLWLCGIAVLSLVFGGTIWLMLQWFQFRRFGVLYMLPLPPLGLAAGCWSCCHRAEAAGFNPSSRAACMSVFEHASSTGNAGDRAAQSLLGCPK